MALPIFAQVIFCLPKSFFTYLHFEILLLSLWAIEMFSVVFLIPLIKMNCFHHWNFTSSSLLFKYRTFCSLTLIILSVTFLLSYTVQRRFCDIFTFHQKSNGQKEFNAQGNLLSLSQKYKRETT